MPGLLKDFFSLMKRKYCQRREQVSQSNNEENVYSLKKIVEDLQSDNMTCLQAMSTSVVANSRSTGYERVILLSLLECYQILAIWQES